MKKESNNLEKIEKYIIDVVAAGLTGNTSKVELAALTLARSLKQENPQISKKLTSTISSFSISGGAMRNAGGQPVPVDAETQMDMVTIIHPNEKEYIAPTLSPVVFSRIESFLEERKNVSLLLENNLRPSSSLLLIGQPGTGKTMLARFVATQLNKTLIVLDISTSMSSLLGKTGSNLKKVIQYAKQNSSVLLFDEFDAIAKKRDDNTDLGEIKRVVNVLLMELEDWPINSVFMATSNHPELLDKAIWRRFDHVVEIPLPDKEQRQLLLEKDLRQYFTSSNHTKVIEFLSELLDGKSAADICKLTNNIQRRIILKKENVILACLNELEIISSDKKVRGRFCVVAKELLGDSITVREIAEITGLSPAGVQHHLTKAKNEHK